MPLSPSPDPRPESPDPPADSPNPYAPPRVAEPGGAPPPAQVDVQISPWRARAVVRLRDAPEHVVEIVWSGFSFCERYLVDGQLRLQAYSFALSGSRRFSLEDDGRGQIEVRFRYFPFWSARMFHDGELVVPELFPRLRRFYRILTITLLVLLATGGLLALAGFTLPGSWLASPPF